MKETVPLFLLLLKDSWFTMLCQFLPHSKAIRLCICIHSFLMSLSIMVHPRTLNVVRRSSTVGSCLSSPPCMTAASANPNLALGPFPSPTPLAWPPQICSWNSHFRISLNWVHMTPLLLVTSVVSSGLKSGAGLLSTISQALWGGWHMEVFFLMNVGWTPLRWNFLDGLQFA